MPRRVAPHRPTFHSGKPVLLTRAPTFRAITATCFIEVPICSRFLPRLAEKSETFCANKGTFIRKRPTFSPNHAISSWNAPLFPALLDFFAEWHEFFAALYYFFCWIARFLLRFLGSLSAPPPTRHPPPPSFIHNVLSAYVYLPSIRCPRRPLRHESRYRRRSPRRMGTINRDRRTTPDHRQRIARCAN